MPAIRSCNFVADLPGYSVFDFDSDLDLDLDYLCRLIAMRSKLADCMAIRLYDDMTI